MRDYSFKDLKKAFVEGIRSGLEAFEFTYKGNEMDFEKVMPDMRWSFRLGFIKHQKDFEVIASVSLGFDRLRDLLYHTEFSSKTVYCMGGELENLNGAGQMRWHIATMEDVEAASLSLLKAFNEIGLPYLEKYSVLPHALQALSGDDRTSWLHCPAHDARAKFALGIAFLMGDKNDFLALAEKKTQFLSSRDDRGLQSFLDFKADLESKRGISGGRWRDVVGH